MKREKNPTGNTNIRKKSTMLHNMEISETVPLNTGLATIAKFIEPLFEQSYKVLKIAYTLAMITMLGTTLMVAKTMWQQHTNISVLSIRTNGLTPNELSKTRVYSISPWGSKTQFNFNPKLKIWEVPCDGKRVISKIFVSVPSDAKKRIRLSYSYLANKFYQSIWLNLPENIPEKRMNNCTLFMLPISPLGTSILPIYKNSINWKGDILFFARSLLPGIAAGLFAFFFILFLFFIAININKNLYGLFQTNIDLLYLSLILGLMAAFCFYLDLGYRYDYIQHVEFAAKAMKTGLYPSHCAFHVWINILSGFSGNITLLKFASIIILTASKILKLILTYLFLQEIMKNKKQNWISSPATISIGLFFSYSIINWYTFPSVSPGQFGGTKWDNPTVVLLMPLALILFARLCSDNTRNDEKITSFLLVISTLIKPNWVLGFLPLIGFAWVMRRFTLRRLLIYSTPSCILLGIQFLATFTKGAGGGLCIAPFVAWASRSPCLWGSILLSFAFPALITLVSLHYFYPKINKPLLVAWSLLAIFLIQYILIGEKGPRLFHGNFGWGIFPATYILFLLSAGIWVGISELNAWKRKVILKFCGGLFWLHAATGLMYYIRVCLGYGYNG